MEITRLNVLEFKVKVVEDGPTRQLLQEPSTVPIATVYPPISTTSNDPSIVNAKLLATVETDRVKVTFCV